MPALLALALLLVLSGFMWTRIFESADNVETATSCRPPGVATSLPKPGVPVQLPLGTTLPRNALDQVAPISPQEVHFRVLNGNGESRQAALITDELSNLGFAKGGDAANDPVYANQDLICHGQIRYGPAGTNAARTLSLIAPCAQLVRDDRQDNSVDLALGKKFDDIKTTSAAKKVLQELKNSVPQRDHHGGAQHDDTPPAVDGELLSEARDVSC